jgi:hypothetical protein
MYTDSLLFPRHLNGESDRGGFLFLEPQDFLERFWFSYSVMPCSISALLDRRRILFEFVHVGITTRAGGRQILQAEVAEAVEPRAAPVGFFRVKYLSISFFN